jgi:hypothetical protein
VQEALPSQMRAPDELLLTYMAVADACSKLALACLSRQNSHVPRCHAHTKFGLQHTTHISLMLGATQIRTHATLILKWSNNACYVKDRPPGTVPSMLCSVSHEISEVDCSLCITEKQCLMVD